METLKDYYLDSLSELKVDGWMYRTKGSAQIQVWREDVVQSLSGEFIDDRRYFRGMYKGRRFFGKQFMKPNVPSWSIRDSIKYQFENLLLLEDMEYVPDPLFFTDNVIGMEYVEGRTIKELALKGKLSPALAARITTQLVDAGQKVVSKLNSVGRKYDCSYNNILVRMDNRIMFVDFDYSNLPSRNVDALVQILKDLVVGVASFSKDGQLQYKEQ